MPCPDTAPRICTEMRRDGQVEGGSCCTNGMTNTPPPMTTFWPDRSVEISPVSGLRTSPLPLRPVTMNDSLGPATL